MRRALNAVIASEAKQFVSKALAMGCFGPSGLAMTADTAGVIAKPKGKQCTFQRYARLSYKSFHSGFID